MKKIFFLLTFYCSLITTICRGQDDKILQDQTKMKAIQLTVLKKYFIIQLQRKRI
jgi:hypothetical protein